MFYSHYQNYSRESNKFPLDPETDYMQVVADTIEDVIEFNRLPIEIQDIHSCALEIVMSASVLATKSGRLISFRDVVLAAILLDWASYKRKKPSRFTVARVGAIVEAIIPQHF